MSSYKWIYKNKEVDSELFSKLREIAGSDIITNLLINRGITTVKQAKAFLNPDDMELSSPFVFPDMQKSVERINQAIQKQENIVIYGDFDSDGVTSTSLMYKTLKHLGANVDYYIPDRSDEGHGLNRAALCKLISQQKTKLFITVDCGISNIAEVKLIQSLGTDVILTDHHEPLEQIPKAFAIINPKMLDIEGIKQLAGVGVAFKLAQALLETSGKSDFIQEILHLVAIGTVGDVVPLLEENRTLVYRGLELINKKPPASIAKLMQLAGFKPDKKITSTILAFTVVPRINAIGRLAEASTAVEFLVTEDAEKLEQLAAELDKNNKERQEICETTFQQAAKKILDGEVDLKTDKAVILGDVSWHPGIIGLVASRLVEKYYRPALLFSLDEKKKEARCSARSIDGVNIFEVLSNFSEYFLQFGGHSLAAGFCASLEKISFEKLKSLILSHISKLLGTEMLMPELKIDVDIDTADLTEDFIDELDKLAPYGELNPYPVFSFTNLVLKSCNTMGQKKNHLKIILTDEYNNCIEAVWWQKHSLDICPMERVNVAFMPSINNYMDKNKVQLILKDVQPVNKKSKKVCFLNEEDSDAQWLDHRDENGFKKDFLEYLNSRGNSVSIFAESRRALEIIDNIPFLKPLVFDRLSVKSSQCLIFLDFPSDDVTFMNVIKEAAPVEVHLFGLINEQDPVELIKKISGMFKYAHNEKNGTVNLGKAATSLAISNDLLFSCAQLLDTAGVIEILQLKETSLEIKFVGSVNLNSIQTLSEYQDFIGVLNEFEETKNEYKCRDIELIKETLDNYSSFLNII
ncbi:MAG: single-stranded-DNA-specific exonuclease RecJ [Candidatus Melainabacteria bacterium GWF2_37_15]|nr:MAG: single-stranded-DNA-specific exonuclease RecJ [Candidatus Melainabacteria bacterium GWF2_37_15]